MQSNKFRIRLMCCTKCFYFLFFSILFLAILNIFFISRGNFIAFKTEPSSSENDEIENNLEPQNALLRLGGDEPNLDGKWFEENGKPQKKEKHFIPKWMTLDQIIDQKKCPSPFRITLAQNGSNQISADANFLKKWILESNYFTWEREEACIEIYLVENEEFVDNFDKMEEKGRNQMVIFMGEIVAPMRMRKNELAIFVANSFADGQFRPDVDFHLETNVLDFDENFWEKLPMIDSNSQNEPKELFSCQFLIDEDAGQIEEKILKICRNQMEEMVPISDAFGTFLAIGPGNMAKLPTKILHILGNGSVPILLGGPNPNGRIGGGGILPFGHWIRWEKATIWVPKLMLKNIDGILRRISKQKWAELRRNGRFIFEHFLGNARVLIRSIFSDIRQRIGLPPPFESGVDLPQMLLIESKNSTKNETFDDFDEPNIFYNYSSTIFEDTNSLWNQNPTYLDAANPILIKNERKIRKWDFENEKSFFDEKFTVIICTFRRDAKLAFSLRRLDGIPNLDRILVIWNDIGRMPPSEIFPQINAPIFVLNGTRNSILNRFLPLTQIRTEAILILDDDIDIGPNFDHKINFAFRVWQQNRLSLVGPIFRLGHFGHYEGAPQCKFNLVLTDIAFLNFAYFRAFNQEMSPKIRFLIDKETNCEDIAINFLVAHFTGKSPVKILDTKNVGDLKVPGGEDPNGHKGLANRGNHYKIRSKCVEMFSRIFGFNPNIQNNYRVDPLWEGEMAEKCRAEEGKLFKNN